jgi:hypothetical protein
MECPSGHRHVPRGAFRAGRDRSDVAERLRPGETEANLEDLMTSSRIPRPERRGAGEATGRQSTTGPSGSLARARSPFRNRTTTGAQPDGAMISHIQTIEDCGIDRGTRAGHCRLGRCTQGASAVGAGRRRRVGSAPRAPHPARPPDRGAAAGRLHPVCHLRPRTVLRQRWALLRMPDRRGRPGALSWSDLDQGRRHRLGDTGAGAWRPDGSGRHRAGSGVHARGRPDGRRLGSRRAVHSWH